MLKLLLIDLDGTLIDSVSDLTTAVNLTLNHFGRNTLTKDESVKLIGYGAANFIKRAFKSDDEKFLAEALKKFNSYYYDNMTCETVIYKNVVETLGEIKIDKMIYTNKPQVFAEEIAEQLDLTKHFKRVITPETYNIRKPDPYPVKQLANELGLTHDEIMLVGDSIADYDCARNAGIKSAIVTYGYGRYEEIKDADYLLDDFSKLTDLL